MFCFLLSKGRVGNMGLCCGGCHASCLRGCPVNGKVFGVGSCGRGVPGI